jgi:phospholipase C
MLSDSLLKRVAAACVALIYVVFLAPAGTVRAQSSADATTATPIKHLVILFGENVSFDHYFATYPKASNPPGEPAFTPVAGTPAVNNLATAHLLANNPNYTNSANGSDAAEPFRLDRSQANTKSQSHAYTAEQLAYDGGKADLFPKYTGKGTPGGAGAFGTRGQVMGYFDGNTVTAMWRYAQHFAMSDNAYTDTYGPSTPGAIDVISGQTDGLLPITSSKPASTMTKSSYYVNDGQGGLTLISDVDPATDICSKGDEVFMAGRNIGDLLNDTGISWGGFMGGFNLGITNANGTTSCARSTHSEIVGADIKDYTPHHNWFAYYPSTANSTHARPSSVSAIGRTLAADGTRDPANHAYDLDDFSAAVKAGNFPAVSYLKASSYQDAHPGDSDPLDEQTQMVTLINFLEQQPDWKSTAVIVTYDDSDGWYDHAEAKVTSPSFDAVDQVDGPGTCGSGSADAGLAGKPVNGRCGPGTRIPFIVISPWAKVNVVAHTPISQASVIRFIEDNWLGGKRLGGGSFDATTGSIMDLFDFRSGGHTPPLFLDPATGNPASTY